MCQHRRKLTIEDLAQLNVVLDVTKETRDRVITYDEYGKIHNALNTILRQFPNHEIVIRDKIPPTHIFTNKNN